MLYMAFEIRGDSMKTCSKCKRTWPDNVKFCPMDGTPLTMVVEEQEQPTVKASVPDQVARPEPPKKVEAKSETAAKREPSKPEPPPKRTEESKTEQKKSKSSRQFSETKWFMIGDVIQEQDLDPELVTEKELQKQYKPTRELPPEVRKKYSLNYQSEEKEGKKK